MPFNFDQDVAAGVAAIASNGSRPALPAGQTGVAARRQQMEAGMSLMLSNFPNSPNVQSKDFRTKAEDGYEILLRWYSRTDKPSTPGPAILHMHGGGVFALSVEICDKLPKVYVENTGVPILSVDYRLAPEVRAPVPMTDCFTGLQYLVDHARELSVDPNRIAVMGESGGGYLAAALTHYVKSKSGPAICKQILIYPMLDDRPVVVDKHLAPYLVLDVPGDAITGWQSLLGDAVGRADVPTIHSPGRMSVEEAQGLPPAYIDVGQLDVLRDGCFEYVRKLGLAGVDVTFHMYAGAPHVFEFLAPEGNLTKFAMEQRYKAIISI
ncbi:hypothetical protein Q7P37_003954 [Cladosporium fusiforme]